MPYAITPDGRTVYVPNNQATIDWDNVRRTVGTLGSMAGTAASRVSVPMYAILNPTEIGRGSTIYPGQYSPDRFVDDVSLAEYENYRRSKALASRPPGSGTLEDPFRLQGVEKIGYRRPTGPLTMIEEAPGTDSGEGTPEPKVVTGWPDGEVVVDSPSKPETATVDYGEDWLSSDNISEGSPEGGSEGENKGDDKGKDDKKPEEPKNPNNNEESWYMKALKALKPGGYSKADSWYTNGFRGVRDATYIGLGIKGINYGIPAIYNSAFDPKEEYKLPYPLTSAFGWSDKLGGTEIIYEMGADGKLYPRKVEKGTIEKSNTTDNTASKQDSVPIPNSNEEAVDSAYIRKRKEQHDRYVEMKRRLNSGQSTETETEL